MSAIHARKGAVTRLSIARLASVDLGRRLRNPSREQSFGVEVALSPRGIVGSDALRVARQPVHAFNFGPFCLTSRLRRGEELDNCLGELPLARCYVLR